MQKKAIILFIMLPLVLFLLGMGSIGGKPPIRRNAPEPEERIDGLIIDMEGIAIKVTHISYDGELYLPVYRGRALITIPFKKIHKIELEGKEGKAGKPGKRRKTKISFKDKGTDDFLIDENILFLGKLPYGTFQIQAKDLLSIEFEEASSLINK